MFTTVDVGDDAVAESRTFNAAVEELIAANPSVHTVPPAETRLARREGRSVYGSVVYVDEGTNRSIPGPAGEIPLRVFVPPDPRGIYLHIHGGGWVLGAADQQDVRLWHLAQHAQVAVVSVDYRLAPEDPFPAGPDDCEAAAMWLLETGREELGGGPLVIGGESAGAHLSALTLLRLRDRHDAAGAFAGANLVFGAFDISGTPSQRRWGDRNLVLSGPIMEWFYECFTPGMSPEDRRDPEISPLYADLSGMPPALFTVGTLDPLLDDSLFMAGRWAAAGCDADLRVYPESIHAFVAFPTTIAAAAWAAEVAFVRRATGVGAGAGAA